MKTLEEVKAHVHCVGYNQLAIQKIEGFLLGNGLLGEELEMEYMIGERTFDDFRAWFNSEKKEECKQEIDWNEFGFGDFVHVQDGIDVILLGRVRGSGMIVTDGRRVMPLRLTPTSRPCNEKEIDAVIDSLKNVGINFCFVNNEFVPNSMCKECEKHIETQQVNEAIDELNNNYEQLCEIAESISEGNPFKGFANSIVEILGKMVDDANKSVKDDSALIDELEIDAKEAIENIIANLHEGNMNEKEKESVVDALKVLVELGKMYE